MSEYTPTTEQVEFAYANDSEDEYRDPIGYPALVRQNKVAFRRWLAAHDAEKRAEWEAEQGEVTDVERRRVIKDILHYRLLPNSVIEYLNAYLESMGEDE